eukprot:Rmarinus@m.1840
MAEIAKVESNIAEVGNKIDDVERKITEVENRIIEFERLINAEQSPSEKEILRKEKGRLHIKEDQLRKEKKQLRKEKGQLRKEKEQLRDELRVEHDSKWVVDQRSEDGYAVPIAKKRRKAEERRAKRRRAEFDNNVTAANELFAKIAEVSGDENDYSDPLKWQTLPFPFLGRVPKDRFHLVNRSFQFMGRVRFSELLNTLHCFCEDGWQEFLLYGTMGYGKSHILAALAVYLLRSKKRVVYLPDCRFMLLDPVTYLRKALFLCFHDDPSAQEDLARCLTSDELVIFCASEKGLFFIVDQFNALEDSRDTKQSECRRLIIRASDPHVCLLAASANNETAREISQKQTNRKVVKWFGGFSTTEFEAWCSHFHRDLPCMDQDERAKMEYATGKIPLFLNSFVKPRGLQGDFTFVTAYRQFTKGDVVRGIP